jgi:hypothetical protein
VATWTDLRLDARAIPVAAGSRCLGEDFSAGCDGLRGWLGRGPVDLAEGPGLPGGVEIGVLDLPGLDARHDPEPSRLVIHDLPCHWSNRAGPSFWTLDLARAPKGYWLVAQPQRVTCSDLFANR